MSKDFKELLRELKELQKKHKLDSIDEAVDKLEFYEATKKPRCLAGLYRNVVYINNYLNGSRYDLVHLTGGVIEEELLS